MAPAANLIVLTGLLRGRVFPLADGEATIGRDAAAQVPLPDLLVSARHARVRHAGGAWVIDDLGSTNGTFRSGLRVGVAAPLSLGDVIHVGSTELVFTAKTTLEDDAPTGLDDVLAPTEATTSFDVRLVSDTDAELVLAPARSAGLTGILPVVRAVGRSLAEAPDLEALLERIAEHFLRALAGASVRIALAPPEGGEARVVLQAEAGPQGLVRRPPEEAAPPHHAPLLARALEGRGAVLGRAPGASPTAAGLSYAVALPAAGGVAGALIVDRVREDFTRQDLRPLFLVANLAGVHARAHQLLGALRDRNARLEAANAELERARARLARWTEELQAEVAERTAALARSERGYRELFEESRDGNLTAGPDGRVRSINRCAADLLGREPGACEGAPLEALLGAVAAGRLAPAGRPGAGGRPAADDGLFEATVTVGGDERVLELLPRPMAGEGADGGVHVVLRDITARRRSEERMRLLTRIVEGMPEAVVGTTLEGVVTVWNPGAEMLYGFAQGEVLGAVVPTIPDARGAEFERILDAVGGGQSLHVRTERARRDGATVPVEATFAPVPDGAGLVVGLVEIARDLSEQLHIEERLRWRERMASFGEVAAGLAHELGNPLANVRSGLEYLLARERDPAVARDTLETLHRELARLERLLRHVLDLARWPTPSPRPTALGAVVEQVADLVAARAAAADVTVVRRVAPDQTVLADPDQLVQALLNLASNAIEAMPDGGELELAVVDDQDHAGVLVRDTGVGIPPELQGRIFDLFFTRRPGGSGIGLAIVKRIVDLHRGRIEVRSEVGAGTRVTVLLPRDPGAPGPGRAA